jgi:hypothetical protein
VYGFGFIQFGLASVPGFNRVNSACHAALEKSSETNNSCAEAEVNELATNAIAIKNDFVFMLIFIYRFMLQKYNCQNEIIGKIEHEIGNPVHCA